MRKKLLGLVALSLLAVSCKKDYSCACKETYTVSATYYEGVKYSDTYTTDFGTTTTSFKVKKKDSESKCKALESSSTTPGTSSGGWTGGDMTWATTCTLSEK